MATNFFLYFGVGSLFSLEYVFSSDGISLTFFSYSSVSIITVAFPLSAGSTMTDLSFPMFLMAVLSSFVMFGLGNWVDFSAPQTSARSPSLSSTRSLLHAFSVCTMMSFTGNFSGDTAKFRPFARTLMSGSDSSLLDRLITHFFSCVPLRSIVSVLSFFCSTSNLLSFCFCLALLWLYSMSCACTNTCFNVSLVSSCTCLKISSICFSFSFVMFSSFLVIPCILSCTNCRSTLFMMSNPLLVFTGRFRRKLGGVISSSLHRSVYVYSMVLISANFPL